MKRLGAAVLVLFAVTGCANQSAVHLLSADQLPPALYGKQSANAHTQQVIVYFIRGSKLVQQTRTSSSSLTTAQQAMRELLKGPTAEELADGLSTAIPPNTALLSVDVDNNHVATVNLSQEFEEATDPKVHELRIAQVVFTLTELSDVNAVRFRFEGDPPAPVLDENGVPSLLVGPARYSRLAPEEAATHVDPCSLVDSLGTCQATPTANAP
jgi:hypothetical protein